MFKYGNPIIKEGAGRIKTDALNEQRIETVLSRFEEWAKAKGQIDRFTYTINATEANRSLLAFPAAGLAVLPFTCSSESFLRMPLCTLTLNISENFLPSSPLG